MNKNKSIYILILGIFFIGVLVAIFMQWPRSNSQESQKFLDSMAAHFQRSNEPIKLTSITNFPWDRVCTFGADDSDSDAARNWLKNRVGKGPVLKIGEHAERAIIFYDQNVVRNIVIFETSYFRHADNDYVFLAIDEDGDDLGESCFDASSAYLNFILTWELGENPASAITLDDEPFGTLK